MRFSPHVLPDDPLEPTHTPAGITVDQQREILREVRALQNAIPEAYLARDDRLTALSLSGSITRRDMARACGLNKTRIDQIIATHTQRVQDERNTELLERVRRHASPGGDID